MYHWPSGPWQSNGRGAHNASMELTLYQVNVFTSSPFQGKPAVVIPLENWLPDVLLQHIAEENSVAETAFFVNNEEDFHLRWFTASAEMDICNHATLASAFVAFTEIGCESDAIVFDTRLGRLKVARNDQRFQMEFRSTPPRASTAPAELIEAVGAKPAEVLESHDLVFVYEDAKQVSALRPDMGALERLVPGGLIVTAPGYDCDFVSRTFSPALGITEDPVTESSHCTLVPYWAERLGRNELLARQISKRSGEICCALEGDRVRLEGEAVVYLRGALILGSD